MKRFLKKIYNKLYNKKTKQSIIDKQILNGNVVVDENTIYDGLHVSIKNYQKIEKTFLKIGKDSVVNGVFTFENSNGNIVVGDRTFIGGGNFISINSIEIGNDVLISWDCTMMDNNAHSLNWQKRKEDVLDWKKGIEENKIGFYKKWDDVKTGKITIGDKVWIGFGVSILKGVTIGEGAIIGAKSVVTKDVPAWSIVSGNPAKVIRQIPEDER